ncbi:MAG TPA: translation initiation factor IF-2 [Verrucomicrobiae bacterium]|jgi:translation initiation factor IF-2|nr:translation initiation factor IF-2 [Verrucomicrobiae bacterium]
MPVRIYDISKKLGLENKDIISKAKALGITAAKVASSSLDKISAEYLENELLKDHPDIAARLNAPPPEAPKAPVIEEKIVVITAPPPPPPTPPPVEIVAPEPPAPVHVTNGAEPEPVEPRKEDIAEPVVAAAFVEPPPPPPPAPVIPPKPIVPPAPPKPQVGEKVGFIQLPQKPAPKPVEKPGQKFPPQQQQRYQPPDRRTDFGKRGDIRGVRGGSAAPTGPSMPGAKAPQKGPGFKESGPKVSLPADAKVIIIKPPIVVRDLAEQMKQKPFVVIGDLMKLGVFATVNQAIDEATAQKVCALHGFRFEVEKRERGGGVVHAPVKKVELDMEDKIEDLKPRAPVVTIMGHVDHGKTTLLDVIRKSDVAAGEAGGITQHIGAYTISFPHPERKKELAQVTFLDTPGHAAFSSMRARGANVTDIVVLVVAANDGVMPQTLEALSHAKAAKVPILVAVNKIDHPNANPLKVRQQLQDKGLVPDDWGGDTIYVDVSALTKQGVDKLIEMILLQADLLELKANPNRRAKGNVIESGLEPGGPTATVLVRKGTLRVGDVILCGQFYGRVRALINEEAKRLKEAGPSVAVKVLGLNGVPEAGLEFSVVEDEKAARDLAEQRMLEAKALGLEAARGKVTLENLFATLQSQQSKTLKVVVKADTQGSVEAIVEALKKIESDKVTLEIIHSAVGTITDSDVALASASSAVILGFHTRVDSGVADKAKHEGVQIKLYAIIYELIDEVKEAMAGLLDPILKEIIIGSAEVRKIFELSKGAPVAGCIVSTGRIAKGKVRLRRRKEVIYEGITQSLRRFQDEVNEVRAGMECGIRIEGFSEFQVGDAIECYSVEKIAQKL